jgi:hypothetical protein
LLVSRSFEIRIKQKGVGVCKHDADPINSPGRVKGLAGAT